MAMNSNTQSDSQPTDIAESRAYDYFVLLKPKVMSLVVFTGFAGMLVAPGFESFHPFLLFVSLLTLALGAGAAGAVNMWYDRDIDAIMKRTKERPIPLGLIQPAEALAFAVILSLFSVMTMGLALNWMAAFLLAGANLFYVFIYTIWLKRRTPQNIVIGGAAGAFPPMIGYAAVTGDITLFSVILFLIIFLWTPPHFWALSLFANEDYKKAGIPMLPVISGERATKIQMIIYAVLLFPITILPAIFGFTGWFYGCSAALLSGFFIFTAFKVLFDSSHKSARLMFGYSVFYLFALFTALIIDHLS
jgi:protoheme IX farnesyltransferase